MLWIYVEHKCMLWLCVFGTVFKYESNCILEVVKLMDETNY